MSPPSSSAQQLRERLARQLREFRLEAGLTAQQLGRLMGRHPSKISRIEHGHMTPSADDIRAWCTHCQADDRAAELIASIRAIESMWTEWRRMEANGLRHAQESVLPVFERTRRYRAYSSWLLPGIVQTRAYTEAILTAIARRRGTGDDVQEAVAVRMERQRLLQSGHRRFAFLIEESVLRTGVGGAEVMAGQLGHLIQVASLHNVSLGIVPMRPDRDAAWPVEDFWIFDDAQVNVELVSGYLTITQPAEIAMYGRTFARLAEAASYGPVARAIITAAIEVLDHERPAPHIEDSGWDGTMPSG